MTRVLSKRAAGLAVFAALALAACSRSVKSEPARVYVSNEDSRDISVIDAVTDEVVGTVFVGQRPRGLRLSPDGRRLYVAVSGSPKSPPGADEGQLPPADRSADGLAVIDLDALSLIYVVPAGQDPESLDITADGRTAFVSNEETAETSVVDLDTREVRAVVRVGGEPEGVTLRPDGREVFVTSEQDHRVDVIDTAGYAVVATLPTAPRPRSVVFTPDSRFAFVTSEEGGSVQIFDVEKRKRIADVRLVSNDPKLDFRPMGAALSPDGKVLYATMGHGRAVAVIDVAKREVVRTIDGVGDRPWGAGLTPDGRKLYTANGPSNDVSVIDTASGAILKRIPVGASPWGVAVSR